METALTTISTFQDIIITSNNVAEQNAASLAKAQQAADALIEQIDKTEIKDTPEIRFLDQNCLTLLQKANKTRVVMNERRKPITQAFDQIRKYFTDQENQLSPTGEKIVKITKFRNDLAAFIAAEEAKSEAEHQLKIAKEQEKIDCRSYIKTKYAEDFTNSVDKAFKELSTIFESIQLSNVMTKTNELKEFSKKYTPSDIKTPVLKKITLEEYTEILEAVSPSEIAKNEAEYTQQITERKQHHIDRIESKKQELIELANADASEKERLQKEAKERAIKEEEDRKRQLMSFSDRQKTTIEAEKTESSLNNLFDQGCAPVSSVKKTLQIEVLNPAGYGQIFILWFEREGKNLANEKIEKKTIAQMKKYCEDLANKDGEIIDSPSLKYTEIVTASNK